MKVQDYSSIKNRIRFRSGYDQLELGTVLFSAQNAKYFLSYRFNKGILRSEVLSNGILVPQKGLLEEAYANMNVSNGEFEVRHAYQYLASNHVLHTLKVGVMVRNQKRLSLTGAFAFNISSEPVYINTTYLIDNSTGLISAQSAT